MPLRLSVLDQSPISKDATPAQALANTIDLAKLADDLGYHRYLVAEHHGGPMLAGPSPEVLIGPLAAATRRIRVGSAGVMLPHYSPLKVAESFSLLAGLFPGRIDLGVGRAPGTDRMTAFALQRDRRTGSPSDDFLDQLTELLGYLEDRMPEDHPFRRLAKSLPGLPEAPEVSLLGSSLQSAIWAGELGLPYVFADFINSDGVGIVADYRARFVDARLLAPRVCVGAWVLVADTDEEAERLASSHRMAFTMLRRGRLIAVPPPDEAVRFLQREAGPPVRRRTLVGSPETVKPAIERLAADYGAEEVIAVTITYDHAARRRSYELLAEAFDLAGAKLQVQAA